jgi:thymidylate synthase (FAD)
VAALLATGISRNLSHELVRHRIGMSPSQRSQRYVDESDVAFVAPPALLPAVNGYLGSRRSRVLADAGWWQAGRAWVDHCAASLEAYASVLPYLESIGPLGDEHRTARRKMAREAARSVLPGCVETKVFLTFNGRALRNFLEQRGAAGADAEMRRFALAVLAAMSPGWPNLLADCRVEDHPEAGPVIVTEHRKV